MKINDNYNNLKDSYLFYTVSEKIRKYKELHPDKKVIKLSIGDVTRPLVGAVVEAMKNAADEQLCADSFKGYGPYEGYDFLRSAIAEYYRAHGAVIDADEVFVSDGAKSDISNILDIFSKDNVVLVPDPVYPVYVDTNIMDGRKVILAKSGMENGFLPMPDDTDADIVYICSPNNPTGAVYSREQLEKWVEYANNHDAIILFDAAYEAFISDKSLPRSIFEIEGARTCAIEFGSFSKTAGFTGTRCGYAVIPSELVREGKKISTLWLRRQSTKYNGTPYIIQRGAAAVFTEKGEKEVFESISYYKRNAEVIAKTLDALDIYYTGGVNSPYIWMKCPNDADSWEFFDFLLEKANVAGTPGSGFGECGNGFFRLTAFGTYEDTVEACERLKNSLMR